MMYRCSRYIYPRSTCSSMNLPNSATNVSICKVILTYFEYHYCKSQFKKILMMLKHYA